MIIVSSQSMIAEADILLCERRSISSVGGDDVNQYLLLPTQENNSPSPIISDSLSIQISLSPQQSVVDFSTSIQTPFVESSTRKFIPRVRSGSHTDKGPRKSNEDEHISIDDLSVHLGSPFRCSLPYAFYAVFDGHGGPEAAAYVKNHAMRLFFKDADLPQMSDINDSSLETFENSHRKAFLLADQALAEESNNVCAFCGTTALTVLVLGGHLLVANAGDCRAVLCRKGVAVQMSQDHRPSSLPERTRVEELGGCIEYGYLNGELSVTRALGDWYMKSLHGPTSPLIAEPEFQKVILTEDDEFLIIGCDGIWDVMSNQDAVSFVRRELRRHDDPKQCAQELVNRALCLDSTDNLTAIIVCFSSRDSLPPQRPRLRRCSLSEEARNRLRSLLPGN